MTFPLERSAVAVTRRRSALSRRPICAGPMVFHIGVSGSRQSCVGGMRLVDKAGSSTMPPIVKERGSSYISGGGCGLLPSALKDFTITTLAPRSAWAHLTGQLPTALCTCNPPSLAPRLPTPLPHIGAMYTSAHPLWRGLVTVLGVGQQQDLWCPHHGLLQQHNLLAPHERRTGS